MNHRMKLASSAQAAALVAADSLAQMPVAVAPLAGVPNAWPLSQRRNDVRQAVVSQRALQSLPATDGRRLSEQEKPSFGSRFACRALRAHPPGVDLGSCDDRVTLARIMPLPDARDFGFQTLQEILMKQTLRSMAMLALLAASAGLQAQSVVSVPPQNVVQLSASGAVETAQDLLTVSLNATREGADAATVQSQLKTALDVALAEARKAALPGQLDVRTGNFSLYPRYGRDGRITTWQGSSELVLEGRDFARISATTGKIQTLNVGQVAFSLSREQRARVEAEAQAIAIERFKAKAGEIARGFGFSGYTLREISVNANDQGFVPRPRMMAMEAKASAADAPLPVEAGRSTVLVTVSGSVQMR